LEASRGIECCAAATAHSAFMFRHAGIVRLPPAFRKLERSVAPAAAAHWHVVAPASRRFAALEGEARRAGLLVFRDVEVLAMHLPVLFVNGNISDMAGVIGQRLHGDGENDFENVAFVETGG